jgi:hypothetical protein
MKKSGIAKLALLVSSMTMSPVMATNARLESMGKSSTFIMDDMSIFKNPANVGLYPNYLIGEFGNYPENPAAGENLDPQNPWFGGIFSLGLGEEKHRDPRITIGGAFNRKDELLKYLPDSVVVKRKYRVSQDTVISVPRPVTNMDGFLGFSDANGNMYGAHLYVAMQDGADDHYVANDRAYAAVLRGALGVNFDYDDILTWEIYVGLNRISFGDPQKGFFDAGSWGFFGGSRMFYTIAPINGQFVPAGEYSYIQTEGGFDKTRIVLGPGVNVDMNRGFFWLGAQYLFEKTYAATWSHSNDGKVIVDQFTDLKKAGRDVRTEYGVEVSFGIERNIWWDWFVIRVGGKKKISYVVCDLPSSAEEFDSGFCGKRGNFLLTNPSGDGTSDDHVGFGFGLNVEERLKIDVNVAEDLLYRNPFQGGSRIFSRISATYSF